jgi:hypothetical protein
VDDGNVEVLRVEVEEGTEEGRVFCKTKFREGDCASFTHYWG